MQALVYQKKSASYEAQTLLEGEAAMLVLMLRSR